MVRSILLLVISIFNMSFGFAQNVPYEASSGTGNAQHHHTPETYGGKISCQALEHHLADLNDGRTRAFCSNAILGCESMMHLKTLDPKDPLYDLLYDRLPSKISLDIEICELAIQHYDPEFYAKHLKR